MPCNVGIGQTSYAYFADGSDLEFNQMFEKKDELTNNIRVVPMLDNFEYKVVKSNTWLVECVNKNCKWRYMPQRYLIQDILSSKSTT